jgi:hypothetical protein
MTLTVDDMRAKKWSWQNIANMLGRSVDSVRAQHDQTYLRAYIAVPTRAPEPDMALADELSDAESHRSPFPKGPNLQAIILIILDRNTASVETIAALIGTSVESTRSRLSALRLHGLIDHDGRHPRTWSITDDGRANVTRRETSAMVAA